MIYQSGYAIPPRLEHMTPAARRTLLEVRAGWYGGNPWIPSWPSNAAAQKGASDAMKEAQRTQREHERLMALAALKPQSLRRAA